AGVRAPRPRCGDRLRHRPRHGADLRVHRPRQRVLRRRRLRGGRHAVVRDRADRPARRGARRSADHRARAHPDAAADPIAQPLQCRGRGRLRGMASARLRRPAARLAPPPPHRQPNLRRHGLNLVRPAPSRRRLPIMRLLPSFGRNRIRTTGSTAESVRPVADPVAHRVLGSARPAYRGSRVRSTRLPVGYQSREAMDDGVPRWLHRAGGVSWRILAVVALVVLFAYAMAKIQIVFIAVFLSLVVASVLRPVVNFYSRAMPRGLATAAAILSALVVVGGLITYVVTSVTGQWEGLVQQFSSGIGDLTSSLQNLLSRFGLPHDQLEQWTSPEQLERWRDDALSWLEQNQSNIISSAASSAGSIFEVFATLALSMFVTIFFLARGTEMWQWFVNQLPSRVRS